MTPNAAPRRRMACPPSWTCCGSVNCRLRGPRFPMSNDCDSIVPMMTPGVLGGMLYVAYIDLGSLEITPIWNIRPGCGKRQ